MRSLRSLFTAVVLAVAAVAAVPAAPAAASSWTVNPGGAFVATSSNLVLTIGSGQITCADTRVTGTLQTSSPDGVGIGTISSVAFDNGTPGTACSGPLGSGCTVTPALPWSINVTGQDPVTGRITGTITVSVHITCSLSLFGSCAFDVTGSVGFTYDNLTGVLHITSSSLTISGVSGSGCGVAGISNGQHPTLTGDFQLSPPQMVTPL